jgi:hypothetical protein
MPSWPGTLLTHRLTDNGRELLQVARLAIAKVERDLALGVIPGDGEGLAGRDRVVGVAERGGLDGGDERSDGGKVLHLDWRVLECDGWEMMPRCVQDGRSNAVDVQCKKKSKGQ